MTIWNWLIYPLTVAEQQHHIDFSEHLLQTVQPGDPATLYWSMAKPSGIVLGFSQKPSIINPVIRESNAFPIYHRRAGGTAVLVGSSLLSLDVVLPPDHPFIHTDLVEAYRWFGEVWLQTLLTLGVQSRTVTPEEAHAQRDLRRDPAHRDYEQLMNRACYGSLSPYEIAIGKRKVVGFDMIRRRTGSLLQAGVLLQWDTGMLAQLLGHTDEEQTLLQQGLQDRAVGLDTILGREIQSDEVIAAFEQILIPDQRHRLTMR
ncbi:MAG TPA: hypothetical protein VL461_06925 [Dictyobacter sp.]|jgi:lipoate-protein ligase A|nr:hypothetical protein [Dictyobacter sp.]